MSENKAKTIFFWALAVFSFFARLLPHAPNFAPVGALGILAGARLPKKYALFLPLAVMLLADYYIGFYETKVMLAVYLSFLLYVVLGNVFGKGQKIGKLSLAALMGAVLFFLITNFAVWAFTPLYQKDLSGLLMSYTLALPFFKNTLLGDLFYTASFFAVYELAFKKILSNNLLKRRLVLRNNPSFVKI